MFCAVYGRGAEHTRNDARNKRRANIKNELYENSKAPFTIAFAGLSGLVMQTGTSNLQNTRVVVVYP
jgi:hypothetical protein